MKGSRKGLEWAASEGVLSRGQAEGLWRVLEERDLERTKIGQ
jgi:hypothetical protein